MATTILQSFKEFKSNLEITDLQQSSISTTHNNIRDHMSNKMDVLDDFLAGSYSRNTLIAPLSKSDVDIFIVLDTKYYEDNGQVKLLDRVIPTTVVV